MCLVLLAYRPTAKFPLILCGNRDEFYARPTDPAAFWKEAPGLIAGRDRKGGGTWLGVTRAGRWATVTNYRDPRLVRASALSRGVLVSDLLQATLPIPEFLAGLTSRASLYNPFSLLAGDARKAYFFSSRDGSSRELSPGVYGLSNHLLDTPWPKLEQAKARFRDLLALPGNEKELPADAILEILQDRQVAPDEELPDTGIGREHERGLSSIFIAGETYGTRSSTLLALSRSGDADFEERSFGPSGREIARARIHFSVQQPDENLS